MKANNLTAQQLRAVLHYDPGTGVFTRRSNGKVAGSNNGKATIIHLRGENYVASRLAWLYVHGSCEVVRLVHLNGDPHDNRIANLVPSSANPHDRSPRPAPKTPGQRKRPPSGFHNVYQDRRTGKYFGKVYRKGHKPIVTPLVDTAAAAAIMVIGIRNNLTPSHPTE